VEGEELGVEWGCGGWVSGGWGRGSRGNEGYLPSRKLEKKGVKIVEGGETEGGG